MPGSPAEHKGRTPTIVSVAIAVIVVTVAAAVTDATEVIGMSEAIARNEASDTSEEPETTATIATIVGETADSNVTGRSAASREHGPDHPHHRVPRARARARTSRLELACLARIGTCPTVRRL